MKPPRCGPRADAFTTHLWADVLRLGLILVGIVLIMVCLRVAWHRLRDPEQPHTSLLALLSYACFAVLPVFNGLDSFGTRLQVTRTIVYVTAVGAGAAAVFTTPVVPRLTIRPPWRRDREGG